MIGLILEYIPNVYKKYYLKKQKQTNIILKALHNHLKL